MKKLFLLPLLFITIVSLACTANSPQTVRGSGNVTSETRPVTGFTGVELASSGQVIVSLGDSESVVVEADDNLLPYIQTTIRNGVLVIGAKPLTSISMTSPVHVTIIMKSLNKASVTGSGDMTIDGAAAQDMTFSLPGSGTITAAGTADSVTITLKGSGDIRCGDLQAKSANVKINGSGNVTVFASENLTASIFGSGNIQYLSGPTNINKSVTGSGNITAVP